MDIIEELKNYKRNLGFSNEEIAEKSGIPLGTVQKIFGGVTRSPRRKTLLALEAFFRDSYRYDDPDSINTGENNSSNTGRSNTSSTSSEVRESSFTYNAEKDGGTGSYGPDPGWIIKSNTEGDPYNENGKLIFTRQGTYTLDDFYALPDGVRAELIDGVLYEFNAPSLIHQTVVFQVAKKLDVCAESHNCVVFISPVNVQLDKDNRTMIEPDIAVLCDKGKAAHMRSVYGAPELVLEVLSDSTRKRDLTIKTAKYQQAGCREYWIVDPKNETVIVYFFEDANVIYHYTFNDKVPVRMSDGKCVIDFSEIKEALTWFSR